MNDNFKNFAFFILGAAFLTSEPGMYLKTTVTEMIDSVWFFSIQSYSWDEDFIVDYNDKRNCFYLIRQRYGTQDGNTLQ